jgi:hypothetical protein
MTQLDIFAAPPPETHAELSERMQAEIARPAHWAEPPRKLRTSQRPGPDYPMPAWLDHAAICPTCSRAHDDYDELRRGTLEAEPVVACGAGLPLMPWSMLLALEPGGWQRGEAGVVVRRVVAWAKREQGRGAEMHIGVAWSGGPVSDE